jgi:hypothetical protein
MIMKGRSLFLVPPLKMHKIVMPLFYCSTYIPFKIINIKTEPNIKELLCNAFKHTGISTFYFILAGEILMTSDIGEHIVWRPIDQRLEDTQDNM